MPVVGAFRQFPPRAPSTAGKKTALALAAFAVLSGASGRAAGRLRPAGVEAERRKMVDSQIAGRGVKDPRVLAAMEKVPRHLFVAPDLRGRAHEDGPLPIGHGQTISQPYIVALMSELLELQGGERVLEIGTGSGYQAAVLAELAGEVYSIEIVEELAREASRKLGKSGHGRVHVRAGDGYRGWPEAAPFDAVIVTCAPNHVPQPLVDQLKEGGRLVIPVGDFPRQTLYRMEKRGGKLVRHPVIPVLFVPMTGEARP